MLVEPYICLYLFGYSFFRFHFRLPSSFAISCCATCLRFLYCFCTIPISFFRVSLCSLHVCLTLYLGLFTLRLFFYCAIDTLMFVLSSLSPLFSSSPPMDILCSCRFLAEAVQRGRPHCMNKLPHLTLPMALSTDSDSDVASLNLLDTRTSISMQQARIITRAAEHTRHSRPRCRSC